MRLTEITRTKIKKYLADLSRATKIVNGLAVPQFSQNTLRLIICALRSVLSAAVEDGLILTNPASRVGRFAKSSKPAHEASAMTREEVERFLSAVDDVCPEWKAFFLTA